MYSKYYAKISGTGHYVPEKVLTNADLEKIVDTSDEWIKTRTGMSERRVSRKDQPTSDLAYRASLKALEMAKLRPKDLDMIIVATVTPDYVFPTVSCILLKKLGIKNIPAFDVSAGCTGWIYAANIARQFISNGVNKNILVIGVEELTKITNYNDRTTCVLFGDGAGATIFSRAEEKDISKVIDGELSADGNYGSTLIQEAGGTAMPASHETIDKNLHTIYMEGNKIYKLAIRSMYNMCMTVLKRNNMDVQSIDWLLTHQANLRIIDALGQKLKIDPKKVIVNIEKYGNTSSATIPIALDEAIRNNKIRRGDLVLMASFGAGLTFGSLLIRY